jgi:hypothetical protein
MSWRDRLRPGVLPHVVLHSKLQSRYSATAHDVKADLRSAGFHKALVKANVRKLERLVHRLNWTQARSTWSDYTTHNTYTDAEQHAKEQFVRAAVSDECRQLVWDLGANTGHYSRIAAENSDYVMAMDADHLAVERLYQSLKAEKQERILPLVGNVVDASPNLGWRGAERKSLRERGRPELTLCLALIHHVVIGAHVPLREFIDWLASLGSDVVIEFVDKSDPMVKTLLRNKRDDYSDYSLELFERWLSQHFRIVRREPLASGTRTLFHGVAKSGPVA